MTFFVKEAIRNGGVWNPVIAAREIEGDDGVALPIGCTSYKQAMDYGQDFLDRHADAIEIFIKKPPAV